MAVVEGDVVSVGDAWPAATPAEIPPTIASRAAESEGDVPPELSSGWPPSPAMIAAELEAGKASVPVGESN